MGRRDRGSKIRNTAGKYQFGRICLLPAEPVVMKGFYTTTGASNTQQVLSNCYQQLTAFAPRYGQFLSTPILHRLDVKVTVFIKGTLSTSCFAGYRSPHSVHVQLMLTVPVQFCRFNPTFFNYRLRWKPFCSKLWCRETIFLVRSPTLYKKHFFMQSDP